MAATLNAHASLDASFNRLDTSMGDIKRRRADPDGCDTASQKSCSDGHRCVSMGLGGHKSLCLPDRFLFNGDKLDFNRF
jgi:hypothetical protein